MGELGLQRGDDTPSFLESCQAYPIRNLWGLTLDSLKHNILATQILILPDLPPHHQMSFMHWVLSLIIFKQGIDTLLAVFYIILDGHRTRVVNLPRGGLVSRGVDTDVRAKSGGRVGAVLVHYLHVVRVVVQRGGVAAGRGLGFGVVQEGACLVKGVDSEGGVADSLGF